MAVSHFCSCALHACSSQPGGRRRVTKDALRRHGADDAVRRLRMLHERQAQADSAQASASSSRAGFALPPLPRDARPVHHMRAESPTQRPGGAPAACVESDSDATSFGDNDDSGMMWDNGGDDGFDAPAFGVGLTGVDLPEAMSPTRPASPLCSPVPSLLQTDPASSKRSFSRKPDSDAEMTGDESPAAFVTVDDDAQHTADSAGAHAMSLVERTLQHRSMQDAALQLAPPVRHSGTLIVPSGLDLTAAFYALLLWLLSGGTSVPQIVVLLIFWKTRVLPALAASAREAALTPAVISIDACRGHIGVDARLQRFASCPSSSCHALHAIRTTDGRPIDACKECGTPLLGPTGLPLSIFAVYSLKDFIASLLIQPKVEDALMREFVRERTGRSDFRDGTAWSDGFETNELSLTFALGCDGFQVRVPLALCDSR